MLSCLYFNNVHTEFQKLTSVNCMSNILVLALQISESSGQTYSFFGFLWLVGFLVPRTHSRCWCGTPCWATGLNKKYNLNANTPNRPSNSSRGVAIELTLQQEGVCGSTNIHLLDVIVRSYRVVTNDKTRDVARCGHVRHCPCHSDVVRTHPSKLQLGGCWNDWKNKTKELKNEIFCLESEKYFKK